MLCFQISALCPIFQCEDGWILTFDVGKATLKAIGNMLMMRVEADDLIGLYSITTLIEGYLIEDEDINNPSLLWIQARVKPFASLSDYISVIKDDAEIGDDND